MRNIKAFTLVELLISLVILAILLTVAVPSYNALFTRQELLGSTQQLYQFLTLARSQAIKNNQKIYVHFCKNATSEEWRMAQSTVANCDCFENDNTSSNYCSVNSEQFNQQLVDGKSVFLFSKDITFSSNRTSYNTMRFSTVSGHISLEEKGGSRLQVKQSAMRLSICAPGGARLGYPSC